MINVGVSKGFGVGRGYELFLFVSFVVKIR